MLKRDNEETFGEATARSSGQGLIRAAALATLEAVQGLLKSQSWAELETVAVQRLGECDVVVVTVTTGEEGRVVSGAAVVDGDRAEATVRAVLHALNRKL